MTVTSRFALSALVSVAWSEWSRFVLNMILGTRNSSCVMPSLFFEEWYDNSHGEMVVGLAFGYVADFSKSSVTIRCHLMLLTAGG